MARTTNYIFDCADLAFVRDFVRKQIAQANGLTDTGLITAVDDMDTALQRLDSQLLSQDSAVQIFADSLRLFDAHDDFHGIVGKLRNGLRVRNYRRKNGSRKASQKTITISHEAWAVLKTMVKHSDASNLSEAILALEIPAEVVASLSRK